MNNSTLDLSGELFFDFTRQAGPRLDRRSEYSFRVEP